MAVLVGVADKQDIDLVLVRLGIFEFDRAVFQVHLGLLGSGDAGKAAKAKRALVGAITGILVSLSATMIVNTITGAIGSTWSEKPENVLNGALGLVFAVAGAIAAGFVVYGGISYMTSAGDPGKARRARMIFTYARIGLIVVLSAYGIGNMVAGAVE